MPYQPEIVVTPTQQYPQVELQSQGYPYTTWGQILGAPYITVSSKGIANGLSVYKNDGAIFGPDTLGTETGGVYEAFKYGNSVLSDVVIESGTYTINEDINIELNINIRGQFSNQPVGTIFTMNGTSTLTLGLPGVIFSGIFVDASTSTLPANSTLITVGGTSSCKISNCYFLGNSSTPFTILNIYGSQITFENSWVTNGGGNAGQFHIGNSTQGSDVIYITGSGFNNANNINIYAQNITRLFLSNNIISDFANANTNYELYLDGVATFSIVNTEVGLRGSSTEYGVYMEACSQGYINITVISDGNPHGGIVYSASENENFYFIATFNNVNAYLVNENSSYNGGQLPEYVFTGYYSSTSLPYVFGSSVDLIPHIKLISNKVTPTTPAVPTSATAQKNTNPFPVDIYIYGGTVTEIQITRNGTAYTVFSNSTGLALSGQVYRLNPSNSITVTYTAAPTWEWLSD